MTLRQIAYVSARPDVLQSTHAYVEHFLPWVESVVVVAPDRVAARMAQAVPAATVLTDEDLLGGAAGELDHQTRNITLRAALCRSDLVDDVFLSSDDDYRPLKAVDPERFVRDGKLAGFAFYDLVDWTADATDFDRGQQRTLAVLSYLGAATGAYASHMPQAVDKHLFGKALELARRVAPEGPLDEWSVFGNLGRLLAPERFLEPERHLTLAWPQYPNQWRRAVLPREYVYENFYPELYDAGHLFAGLATTLDPATVEQEAVEKLVRWRRLDLAIRRLEVPTDVVSPWTTSSALRRAYFRALRPARKTLDLLLLGSRAQDRDLDQ